MANKAEVANEPAKADEAQAFEANDAKANEADAEADEANKAKANEADYVEKADETEADDADNADEPMSGQGRRAKGDFYLAFSLTKYSVIFTEVEGDFKKNNNQLGTVEIARLVKIWSKSCSLRM